MKNKILYIIIISIVLIVSCNSNENKTPNFEGNLDDIIFNGTDIHVLDNKHFLSYIDDNKKISDDQLSIIHFILSNVIENASHNMREAEDNTVYWDEETGSEVVYDKEGNKVTGFNEGSFNFFRYDTEPIQHFLADRLPWITWGSSPDDPTFPRERFYAYIFELSYGIQSYIFRDKDTALKSISWESLDTEEKMVYQYFFYLIFNNNYEIKFTEDNFQQLKDDSEFYFKYFDQILRVAFSDS